MTRFDSSTILFPSVAVLDEHTLVRRVTVKPAMCGGSSLFFGQVGDWTWETVSALCNTNVFTARDANGAPTYLAFFYYRTRASATMHPHMFTFGDELMITSRSFDFGPESVLTLHRISFADDTIARPLGPVEFYEQPRSDCLYIENFNRWLTRAEPGSNQDLIRSAPASFQHTHLSKLPTAYSPRRVCRSARLNNSFHAHDMPDYDWIVPAYHTVYSVDVTRDVNGVGLIYFATYFSIIDTAILRLWRALGRSERDFTDRRVLDHKLCYVGNADSDATLDITVKLRQHRYQPKDELVDVVVRDQATSRVLAIVGIHNLISDRRQQ